MAQRWIRVTGPHGQRVTFSWKAPEDPPRVPCELKAIANLVARPNIVGASLFEISDDDCQTWRVWLDEREWYAPA